MWQSSDSFRLLRFIRARHGDCHVNSSTLGLVGRALWVVAFIRVDWVHSGAPFGWSVWSVSLGSLGARPWGRRVYSGSLGSFGRAMSVVGFIWVRWIYSVAS